MFKAPHDDHLQGDPAAMIRHLAVSADLARERDDSETAKRLIDLIYRVCDGGLTTAETLRGH
jgi:hypothetical protein